MRLAGVLLVLALVPACAPAKPPTTSLRVATAEAAPKGAHVIVDDQPLGTLEHVIERGVALPPGKHRITIEADGYLPWDREVDAGDRGGLIQLDVKLVKRPD
jgi:hypothetical protein